LLSTNIQINFDLNRRKSLKLKIFIQTLARRLLVVGSAALDYPRQGTDFTHQNTPGSDD
jgi:hypothetical protein